MCCRYGKLELIGNINLLYESLALSARVGLWPATKSGFFAILNAAVRNSDLLPMTKDTLFQVTNVDDPKHANATLMVPEDAASVGCRPLNGEVRDSTTGWRHFSTLFGRNTNTVTRSFTSPSSSRFYRSTQFVPVSHSTVTTSTLASSTSQFRTTTSCPLRAHSTTSTAMPRWMPSSTFRPTIPDLTTTSTRFSLSKTSTTSPSRTSDLNLIITTKRMTPSLFTYSRTTPAAGNSVTTTKVSMAMPQTTASPMLRTTTSSAITFTTSTTTKTTKQQTDDEENLSIKAIEVGPQSVEDSAQVAGGSATTTKDDDGFVDIDDDKGDVVDDDVEGSADDRKQTTTKLKTEAPTSITSKHDQKCDNVLGKCTVTVPLPLTMSAMFSTTSLKPSSSSSRAMSSIQTTNLTTNDDYDLSSTKQDRTSFKHTASSPLTSAKDASIQEPLSTESSTNATETTPTKLRSTVNGKTTTVVSSTTERSENSNETETNTTAATTTSIKTTTKHTTTWTGHTEGTDKPETDDLGSAEEATEGRTEELASDELTWDDVSSGAWTTSEYTDETSAVDFFTIIIDLDDVSSSPTSDDESGTTATTAGYDTTSDADATSPYDVQSTTYDDRIIDIDNDEGSATDEDNVQTTSTKTTTKATSTKLTTTKATTTKATKTKATLKQATTKTAKKMTTITTTTPQLRLTTATSTRAKTETLTDTTTVEATTTAAMVTTTQTTTTSRPPVSMVTPGGRVPFSMATPAVHSRTTVKPICPDNPTTETAKGAHMMLPLAMQSRCRCHCNLN